MKRKKTREKTEMKGFELPQRGKGAFFAFFFAMNAKKKQKKPQEFGLDHLRALVCRIRQQLGVKLDRE
jgi:hypothetical protein